MTAMRVERGSTQTFVKPESGSWQAFDIQLAFYALALTVIGLLMAWTNSAGAPLASGSTFTRGLMWFAIAIVAFTVSAAFDYRWLRTFGPGTTDDLRWWLGSTVSFYIDDDPIWDELAKATPEQFEEIGKKSIGRMPVARSTASGNFAACAVESTIIGRAGSKSASLAAA